MPYSRPRESVLNAIRSNTSSRLFLNYRCCWLWMPVYGKLTGDFNLRWRAAPGLIINLVKDKRALILWLSTKNSFLLIYSAALDWLTKNSIIESHWPHIYQLITTNYLFPPFISFFSLNSSSMDELKKGNAWWVMI